MTMRDQLVTWLNDAYAMEQAQEETLKQHAEDAKDDVEMHGRMQRHIEETRNQAKTVKECLESLGGQVSGAKSAFGSVFGAMQGMVNKPMGDTMVKNAIAEYAAEHFEIATYRALIDTAEQIGEPDIARKLTEILRQEQEMARFIEDNLPGAVNKTLATA